MIDFEVGDRVRVKKDIIVDKFYNGWKFNKYMVKFKGRILTIDKKDIVKNFILKKIHICLFGQLECLKKSSIHMKI